MNESSISPGWALVAIFLLWGLAGALDQPLIDEESAEALPVERAKPVAPPVRLLCHLDQPEPRAPVAAVAVAPGQSTYFRRVTHERTPAVHRSH